VVRDSRLGVSRQQILSFRRQVGALDERLPRGRSSLHRAAWAGLQDSVPYAALHSIHARMQETGPTTWDDPSLVQTWGPRYSVYVVAARDLPVFTLGRMPDNPASRRTSEDLAARLSDLLAGRSVAYSEAGRALGEHPNRLRYAAVTGTVLIRWEGSGKPTIRTVPPPDIDPDEARLELARRYLHVFGPARAETFAEWAGIAERSGVATFEALSDSLTPVTTPVGDAWILSNDEQTIRDSPPSPALSRLLPSGDAYYLLQGAQREILIPDQQRRHLLWTPRAWPGALLVAGEIVGTWRRAKCKLTIQTWSHLNDKTKSAIEEEAISMPIPNVEDPPIIHWTN